MIEVKLKSEAVLVGTFQLMGHCKMANLDEFVGTPDPFDAGPGIPDAPFEHGNLMRNRLIHTDQPWAVSLGWKVGGIMAHTVNPNFKWEIELLLEQWGDEEYMLPDANRKKQVLYGSGAVSGSGTSQVISYPGTRGDTTITIPGGVIPAGIYDIVAVLRLLEADGVTPCFLAAFAEFGKIDFYEGH